MEAAIAETPSDRGRPFVNLLSMCVPEAQVVGMLLVGGLAIWVPWMCYELWLHVPAAPVSPWRSRTPPHVPLLILAIMLPWLLYKGVRKGLGRGATSVMLSVGPMLACEGALGLFLTLSGFVPQEWWFFASVAASTGGAALGIAPGLRDAFVLRVADSGGVLCPQCGYNTAGLRPNQACPECGTFARAAGTTLEQREGVPSGDDSSDGGDCWGDVFD